MQPSDLVEIALRQGFTKDQTEAALRSLDEEQVTRLAWAMEWAGRRHEFQVVPSGQWSNWVVLAGRGSGKTRLGSEWVGMQAASAPRDSGDRSLVVAPTKSDLRGVCYEGDSGLVRVIPSSLIKYYHKSPAPEMLLHNGAIIGGIAAESFERTRGPQWHRAWCDEVAAWGEGGKADPEEVWDTMVMSVRLGRDTRILVTTTPKPKPLIKRLVADPATVMSTASTHVNLDNLSPEFAKRILQYNGTKIGRQEIYAELIDAEEGGIVKRSDLQLWPADKALPVFEFVVMSLDTAFSEESHDKKSQKTDPSACSVWGCFRTKNKPGIMLLDCWAERLGFPDLVDKVKEERRARYGADDKRPTISPLVGPKAALGTGKGVDVIIIEGKASGKSLRQVLLKDGIPTVEFDPGKADKLTRLHVVSPLPVSGVIWIPESKARPGKFMTWAESLIEQLCSFSGEGSVLHDDLLDTTTQAWRIIDWQWLHQIEAAKNPKRFDYDHEPDRHPKPAPPTNPYDR